METDKRKNLMEVEKSTKKSYQEELLNPSITIGKGKGGSYSPALSLQDVFSDSGNASGSSQKASCQSDTGQGEGVQLHKKVRRKQLGGRRRLEQNQKRTIKLQTHFAAMEYEKLNDQFRAIGIRYFSDYLRLQITDS